MKISPVNIYSFYRNTPFKAQESGKPAEVSLIADSGTEDDLKKCLEYLLPQKLLEKSRIEVRQFAEFEDKKLPCLTTPEGKTFVMETTSGASGNKITSTVYELGRDAAVKMTIPYLKNNEMSEIRVHDGDNVHILNFIPDSEDAPTWIMKGADGKNKVEDTRENYLIWMNHR